jgi:hypothetical protein
MVDIAFVGCIVVESAAAFVDIARCIVVVVENSRSVEDVVGRRGAVRVVVDLGTGSAVGTAAWAIAARPAWASVLKRCDFETTALLAHTSSKCFRSYRVSTCLASIHEQELQHANSAWTLILVSTDCCPSS